MHRLYNFTFRKKQKLFFHESSCFNGIASVYAEDIHTWAEVLNINLHVVGPAWLSQYQGACHREDFNGVDWFRSLDE